MCTFLYTDQLLPYLLCFRDLGIAYFGVFRKIVHFLKMKNFWKKISVQDSSSLNYSCTPKKIIKIPQTKILRIVRIFLFGHFYEKMDFVGHNWSFLFVLIYILIALSELYLKIMFKKKFEYILIKKQLKKEFFLCFYSHFSLFLEIFTPLRSWVW